MPRKPLRVLCLDIEGGHGGSSRSLFELLRYLDRGAIVPEVICRRGGSIETRYESLGIACQIMAPLPKVSSLPRISRNLVAYARFLSNYIAGRSAMDDLAAMINERFDVVHFNHEAYFLLARWLRPRTTAAFVMHIRTNLFDTPFARWQCRMVAGVMDHLVFITANERRTFEGLAGRAVGTIIHNVAAPLPEATPRHARIPDDNRLKMACLSNFSWLRGLDRLVELAAELARLERQDFLIVMAGDMKLTRSLPGELGRIGARGGTLEDYVAEHGLSDYFLFLGHVAEPETVLAACDVLLKPTRESNPWGRDIIEALSAGLPVFSVGSDQTFVRDGEDGFLKPVFDAGEWARALIDLHDDQARRFKMGKAAQQHIAKLCNGHDRSADLANVWRVVHITGRKAS
jgi:glycosyltransferase involved in cell wall biosynthesis